MLKDGLKKTVPQNWTHWRNTLPGTASHCPVDGFWNMLVDSKKRGSAHYTSFSSFRWDASLPSVGFFYVIPSSLRFELWFALINGLNAAGKLSGEACSCTQRITKKIPRLGKMFASSVFLGFSVVWRYNMNSTQAKWNVASHFMYIKSRFILAKITTTKKLNKQLGHFVHTRAS